MASTNNTANYSLPQWVSTDKPTWLSDMNGAFTSIDTGIHNAQVKADSVEGTITALDASVDTLSGEVGTLSGTVAVHTTSISTLTANVAQNTTDITENTGDIQTNATNITANTNSINGLNTKVGSVTLTTSEKNLSSAVNEHDSEIGNLSSLSTTNKTSLVGSVNEVDGKVKLNTHTKLDLTHHGCLKLENGYIREWGTYPMTALAYDSNSATYSKSIPLENTFVGTVNGGVTALYGGGRPTAVLHSVTTTSIKIGCDANAAGGQLHWFVEGSWK